MILYISILVAVVLVYAFIGSIVACLGTDEWDDFEFKMMVAVMWPISLIVLAVISADRANRITIPRRIANRLKKLFKKNKEV